MNPDFMFPEAASNNVTASVTSAFAGEFPSKADDSPARRDRMVRDEPTHNPTKIKNRARDKRQKAARKANRRKA